MRGKPEPLDVVELGDARGKWPVGTSGTVVETSGEEAIVEITDEHGKTLELLTVPMSSCASESPSRLLAAPPDSPSARGSNSAQ